MMKNLNLHLYDQIFEKVKPLLRSGRPGDYLHIKSVYSSIVSICENKTYDVNPRVLLTAGILHDCGFGFVKEKYMNFFTGQEKVGLMRDAINELTIAYIPPCLKEFSFSDEEIIEIQNIVKYSDEEVLSIANPSLELQILHDLNLYDRFLPHRIKLLKKLFPDPSKAQMIIQRTLEHIILPEFKCKASALVLTWEKSTGIKKISDK